MATTFNPFGDNPLRTRADVAAALAALAEPLRPCFSDGGGRVSIDASGAVFDRAAAELEGFVRPLWGLAAAAAGGLGNPDWWPLYRRGIAHGTDSGHEDHWGIAQPHDQRTVELATLALALCVAGDRLWMPLETPQRDRLVTCLIAARAQPVFDNNWHFFPILIDLALRRLGAPGDEARVATAFAGIDGCYLGNGWYRDGAVPRIDHYGGFGFHFYGLLHARLSDDPERRGIAFERAKAFAPQFAHWFAGDGAVLPFGRSLTYRFACAAFWGACAFAGLEAQPWGVMKGLYLRHLRWWARQPITRRDGMLSLGYAYPNANMAENYNSPASPYWAFKAFLPLALPGDHPFWMAEEADLADRAGTFIAQPEPGLVIRHEPGHTAALSSGQSHPRLRGGAEKYAKFAWSTRYAFSVEAGPARSEASAFDSMLALGDADGNWRVREACSEARLHADILYAIWHPWRDVRVETWLYWDGPWQVRVHRLHSPRALASIEGGFCLPRPDGPGPHGTADPGRACCDTADDFSGIADLAGSARTGQIHLPEPNTNLLFPRTILPRLGEALGAGETVLAAGILVSPDIAGSREAWARPPTLRASLPRW